MTDDRTRRMVDVPTIGNVYDDVSTRGMASDPIPRHNLHEVTADRVRALILDGELLPGQRISEQALCVRFGVSRTPVREALKALASEGLVTIVPNKGAAVTELSASELFETFTVMAVLEALAGELACRLMSDDEIEAVARLHARMLRHYEQRSMALYFACNQQIHDAILAGARNGVLRAQYSQLAGRIRLARYRANMSDARWATAVAEHEEMMDALRARDGVRLSGILRRHVDGKLAVVLEALTNS